MLSNEGVNDFEDFMGLKVDDLVLVIFILILLVVFFIVGVKFLVGFGSYVLWIKVENCIYFVVYGLVKWVMFIIVELWKIFVGNYKI